MKINDLLDEIDKAYHNASPMSFSDKATALKVVGAGLKFLTDLCEEEEDNAEESTDDESS